MFLLIAAGPQYSGFAPNSSQDNGKVIMWEARLGKPTRAQVSVMPTGDRAP